MVTVPAIFLGLIFLAGAAAYWLFSLAQMLRALKRLSRRDQAEFLAAVEVITEAMKGDGDDHDDQGGGILQPVHAH